MIGIHPHGQSNISGYMRYVVHVGMVALGGWPTALFTASEAQRRIVMQEKSIDQSSTYSMIDQHNLVGPDIAQPVDKPVSFPHGRWGPD
jgi:hypothetical protein